MQIFAHVGVEPYATFKVRKTELSSPMPHPRADLLWQMPHRGEGEVIKCPPNARGEMGALGIDRGITLEHKNSNSQGVSQGKLYRDSNEVGMKRV